MKKNNLKYTSRAHKALIVFSLLFIGLTGFLTLTKSAEMQTDSPPIPDAPSQPNVLGKLAFQLFIADSGIGRTSIFTANSDGTGNIAIAAAGTPPIFNGEPAWSPDGTKIAYNSDGEIFVMNADGSNKVNITKTISPTFESSPSWSANNKIAYERGGQIWTMNPDGSNQIQFSAISQPMPIRPAWSPDGSKLAFTSNGEIYVINADGTNERRVTNNSTVDADPAWSPDGSKIVYGKGTTGIAVINLDGTNETNLTNGAQDGKPSWSSDNTKIAFIRRGAAVSGIYLMNPDGSNQAVFVADNPSNRGTTNDNPTWQPVAAAVNTFIISGRITRGSVGLGNVTLNLSGTTTAATTTDALGNYRFDNLPGGGNYTITPSLTGYVFTPSSRNFANLNSTQISDFSAAGNGLCIEGKPCPANGKIVYTYRPTPGLYYIAVTNSGETGQTLLTSAGQNSYPAFSPDGTKIVFINSGIIQMNADGSNSAQLTNSILDSYPSYSPDGAFIVFVRNKKIYRMNADGSNQVQLTNTQNEDNSPVYSPDGTNVTFTRRNPNTSTSPNLIYKMNVDGTNQTKLTNNSSVNENEPSYSPDGRTIVFESDSLYVMNADGSNRVSITAAIYPQKPSYSPDGTKIVFGGLDPLHPSAPQVYRINTDGSGLTAIAYLGENPDWQPIRRAQTRTPFDFDGDGRADISVFRPSNGVWYQVKSQNNAFNSFQFGQLTDKLAPADYDGDGKTDIAVFRESVPGAGDKAYFYITYSSDNSFHVEQLGTQGDVPMSGDWDGDGIADLAVYRNAAAAGGQSYFFYRPSSQAGVNFRSIPWGTRGDMAVTGDFDGDGKLDAAVVRVSTAIWYILKSSDNQFVQEPFGYSTDIPTPADYDGDGKTNIAVFRPSNGYWYTSTNPQINYGAMQFGISTDLPIPADYDGDGKADIAVYRPTNGVWYLLKSTQGFTSIQFGASEDRPIPNAFVR